MEPDVPITLIYSQLAKSDRMVSSEHTKEVFDSVA